MKMRSVFMEGKVKALLEGKNNEGKWDGEEQVLISS